ncbi:hypothetical protein C8R47DRAFT_993993, partial [Mycena vitilis]
EKLQLKRCSGCRRVSYCDSACQKEDWAQHKAFCRAMIALEASPSVLSVWEARIVNIEKVNFCAQFVGRRLERAEQELICYEPRCLHCGRTEQLIRVEALIDPSIVPCALAPCEACRLSFACADHWVLVRDDHTQKICEGGYDGLSQCLLNQELVENDRWHSEMVRSPEPLPQYYNGTSTYRWIPPRTGTSWTSVKGVNWATTFQAQLEGDFPAARGKESNVWLRRMSEILSVPMTVLYALEVLNENLDWVEKNTLTIHVIGAKPKEFYNAICFENLLHRLPKVKSVRASLHSRRASMSLTEFRLRSDCECRGRKRFNEYYGVHYETLPLRLGVRYTAPDLAIALNSGAAAESRDDWKRTIAFLVASGIPSVFTSYTHSDAVADNALLVAAGAKLVPELGPCRNPWGSMLGLRDVERLDGYYADNMFLAGGFKGR